MTKQRKYITIPVEQLTPAQRADAERSGVIFGSHTEDETRAIREAWEKTLPWLLRGADTETFSGLAEHVRYKDLADAFLLAAKSLCVNLGENPDSITWPRGSVVYYCYHLAVELFLKACLGHAGKRVLSHEVSDLQDAFRETFPDEGLWLHTMFDINVVELAAFGLEPGTRRLPSRADQNYRYFAGRDGKPPEGWYSFAPAIFIGEVERAEADFARIWAAVDRQ